MKTNTYTVRFFADCPNNGARIEYSLCIVTQEVLRVEEIIEATKAHDEGYHEDIADDMFDRFGGEQTLSADHHGVHIETYRSAEE